MTSSVATNADGDGASSVVPISPPSLPLPIFRLSQGRSKYLLYDIDTVTWLRQAHHILGVQIGGMPQFPQQNVFFGLPLELLPEEARLLVEKGLALIVDDLEAHKTLVEALRAQEPAALDVLRHQRSAIDKITDMAIQEATRLKQEEQERGKERRRAAEAKKAKLSEGQSGSAKEHGSVSIPEQAFNAARLPVFAARGSDGDTGNSAHQPPFLFEPPPSVTPDASQQLRQIPDRAGWAATTTTASSLSLSSNLLKSSNQSVPEASDGSYHIFRHLHDHGYYMTPGLRFGCQFSTYPGDPLRFHSHFLATSVEWDEEIDLLDIVGGGRLGTGVKKGYLLGGVQTEGKRQGDVRTFCLEWGGM